jgi:hypothetical protein
MVGQRREVDDGLRAALPRQGVQVGLAKRGDIEPAQRTTRLPLRIQERVVQIQTVDKEDAAVDVCLQKRKNPGVATPGGPRDIPVGENDLSVPLRRSPVKNSLQMSTFRGRPDDERMAEQR